MRLVIILYGGHSYGSHIGNARMDD